MDKDVSQPPLVKLLLNLVQLGRFVSRENKLIDQISSLTSRLQQLEETQPATPQKGSKTSLLVVLCRRRQKVYADFRPFLRKVLTNNNM
jgi:hypothetical protein